MKISLAINTKNPINEWMEMLLESAKAFDEIVVYIDGVENADCYKWANGVLCICDGKNRDIKDGFNLAISKCTGDWICSMCDDDSFTHHIQELIHKIKNDGFGDDVDIIHFPVIVNGVCWGDSIVNENSLSGGNTIPHGSLIRKSVFDEIGGYKINPGADWNLWLRLCRKNYRFKYYSKPVYEFRYGHDRSAWNNQVREFGINKIKEMVLTTE